VGEIAQRTYTYPPLSHVVGYVSSRHGKAGVEDAFDAYLRGGRSVSALSELKNRLLRVQKRGDDLTLTIDLRLQKVADAALGDWPGAIVALDVRTGEVLAMASHPYLNPNTLEDDWEQLTQNPARPFVARALQGQYVPGSAFKVVTASAAVDLGVAIPEVRHEHEADMVVQGFRIRNTNHPQLTNLSFAEEFAWSCNVAFGLTGLDLGRSSPIDYNVLAGPQDYVWPPSDVTASTARFEDYVNRFGFGQSTPFDLPTAAGHVPTGPLTPVDLANTAFGQGELQVSPLQMALATATINRGGEMPSPYLVAEVRQGDAHTALHRPGGVLRRVISPNTANALTSMMVLSVDTAYASPARISGVRVGGKTGTAEVGGSATPHSWFVGFAPADRPGVAVAAIMENRGSGTTFATPAAGKVLEAALRLGY
jgi:peptidoglycan glycosyltransferase